MSFKAYVAFPAGREAMQVLKNCLICQPADPSLTPVVYFNGLGRMRRANRRIKKESVAVLFTMDGWGPNEIFASVYNLDVTKCPIIRLEELNTICHGAKGTEIAGFEPFQQADGEINPETFFDRAVDFYYPATGKEGN